MSLNKVAEYLFKSCQFVGKYLPKKQSTKTLTGKEIVLEGEISYPIPIRGIQPVSIKDILEPNNERIKEIIRLMGLRSLHRTYNEQNLIIKVIENFAAYVHLLPASEDHHHQTPGGLLAHSLDVAVGALKIASSKDLTPKGYPDEEDTRKDCYRYAVFVAGLLHDIGKVFTDMRILSVPDGKQWQPRLEPLTSWATKHKISRYKVEWLPERVHKQHESVSTYVMDKILPVEAKEYLLRCKLDDMFHEIDAAIGFYVERKGFIYDSIRQADSISTVRSFSGDTDPLLGHRVMSLSSQIIRAIHRHRNKWAINEVNGEVWVVHRQVFLTFPMTMEQLRDDLLAHQVAAPSDVTVLMNVMLEQHIISNPDPSSRLAFWLPGEFTPEEALKIQKEHLSGNDSRSWFPVYRLKWYSYYFGDMPLPDSASGIMSINQDGYMVHYSQYADPIDMPPANAKGAKQAAAKPSIQNIIAGANQPAPVSTQPTQAVVQPPATTVQAKPAVTPAKPKAAPKKATAAATKAVTATAKASTLKPASGPVVLKPVARPETPVEGELATDAIEQGEVVSSTVNEEEKTAEVVEFIQEQMAQGVMLIRERDGHKWLNVTRMADFYFRTIPDVTNELKSLSLIEECCQRFDPIKKKAFTVANKVGGELEALLSNKAINLLMDDEVEPEEPKEAEVVVNTEQQVELLNAVAVDSEPVIQMGESVPEPESEPDSGLVMPESCLIADQTDRVYQLLEMARMTKTKKSDRDIIEHEHVLHIRLGWLRFAAGYERDGLTKEWVDSVRVNIGGTSYIEVVKR